MNLLADPQIRDTIESLDAAYRRFALSGSAVSPTDVRRHD